jgi:hypothetical protein
MTATGREVVTRIAADQVMGSDGISALRLIFDHYGLWCCASG